MNNATAKLIEFKADFLKLTVTAINSGVPIQNVILELEQEKFKLQTMALANQMARDADAASKAILPASAFQIPLRNGNLH